MPLGPITHLEWLNRNSLRAYPLREDAEPKLNSGEALPNDVLVDIFVVASLAGNNSAAITSITFTQKTVTVMIGDESTGATIGYATAVLGSDPPNSSISIQSPEGLGSGTVTFGNILNTSRRTDFVDIQGVHSFGSPIPLEHRCSLVTGRPIVESLSVHLQEGEVLDVPVIGLGREIRATISTETIGGCDETVVELYLANPEEFLPDCYPKYVDPLCFCGQLPIISINGVERDPSDLGIDLVFGNGLVGLVTNDNDRSLVALTVEQPGDEVCFEEPVIPDEYGRLGPNFNQDCPPDTNYGLSDSGPECLNPPPDVPLGGGSSSSSG